MSFFSKNISIIVLGCILFSCGNKVKEHKEAQTQINEQKHLNVLFLSIDDLNTWIGCLKNYSNAKTPNLDKLAASGVLFSNTMNEKQNETEAFALTTYGMNNHAVRTNDYRYIQYEDGTEEFYNRKADPNEWKNEAENPIYKNEIEKMKSFLPETNAKWDSASNYTFQPYFVEQKARTSSGERK